MLGALTTSIKDSKQAFRSHTINLIIGKSLRQHAITNCILTDFIAAILTVSQITVKLKRVPKVELPYSGWDQLQSEAKPGYVLFFL